MGSVNFEGGLCTPIQDQTSTSKRSPDNQWFCRSRVASRMRFPRDRALIRLQTRIFLESAVTKLYENA